MSGGVRNLRAMFENKDPAEGEDRGRSPGGGSVGGASTGTSPRPLSKVRTSFVAVERSGQLGNQIGLQRADSGASSTSRRRTSLSIDEETSNNMPTKKQPTAPELDPSKHSALEERIPEALAEKAQPAEKKIPTSNGTEKKKEPAKPAPSKMEEKTTNGHANGAAKSSTAKPAEKPAASKTTTKPAPISTARTTVPPKASPQKNLKSPAMPKTPTTPNRTHAKTKEAPKAKETKAPKASLAPKPATTRASSRPPPAQAHGSAPKTRIPKESPPQTGFKKPRPKSPTRPVKLPASLTAHTASSGSKTSASPPAVTRQSLSRASGNSQPVNSLQAHTAASRSPSRVSTTSTLGRKPSTLKHGSGRPSLGPPPQIIKKQTSRASLPHQPAPADDSFLARMMRPTNASSGKIAEKQETTGPPKRAPSVRRPVTRDGPPKTHDASKGSPAPKTRQAAPSKIATKHTKPVEKGPKTPTPATTPAAKSVAKSEPKEKPVVAAPALEEKIDVPEVQEAPIEEITEAAPISESEIKEEAKVEPEVSKDEPEVEEKIVTPVVETKEEVVVPEPEPVKEQTPVEEPVAISEPVDDTVVETKEDTPEIEAPEVQEPEIVEKRQEILAIVEPEVKEQVIIEPKASVEEPIKEVSVEEPAKVEAAPAPIESKVELEEEDPEDAKAREEIEKLNAEFAKLAAAPEVK